MIRQRIILFIIFFTGCITVSHAQTRYQDIASSICELYDLPPFERAVCCIKSFEGMHRAKDYPYVGYGHKLKQGEHYSSYMSEKAADLLLRMDLRKLCDKFSCYGKDSLLLAALAYNVGPYKILGNARFKKSQLLTKIEAGIRDFQHDYITFCMWKGRKIPSIERRRIIEFLLLYNK